MQCHLSRLLMPAVPAVPFLRRVAEAQKGLEQHLQQQQELQVQLESETHQRVQQASWGFQSPNAERPALRGACLESKQVSVRPPLWSPVYAGRSSRLLMGVALTAASASLCVCRRTSASQRWPTCAPS